MPRCSQGFKGYPIYMGVFRIQGHLIGVLSIRESHYFGVCFRVPYFRKSPQSKLKKGLLPFGNPPEFRVQGPELCSIQSDSSPIKILNSPIASSTTPPKGSNNENK